MVVSELRGFLEREVRTDPGFAANLEIRAMFEKLDRIMNEFGTSPPPASLVREYAALTLFYLHTNASPVAQAPISYQYGSTRSKNQKSPARLLTADSLNKMKDKDLVELSIALELLELEMRTQLTVAKVVTWLNARRGALATNAPSRPFSPLSDRVSGEAIRALD
jgi:hypothetical protein